MYKRGVTSSSDFVKEKPARLHKQERQLKKLDPDLNYHGTFVNLASVRVNGATLTRATLVSWERAQILNDLKKGETNPGNNEYFTKMARENMKGKN